MPSSPAAPFIQFKDVYLKYESKSSFALKGISFSIREGQKVCFVGRTGSGKSSILNCLFRLFQTTQGEILLNGQRVTSMPVATLRQAMSVIPQNGFLFKGSLRENLDPLGQMETSVMQG